MIVKSDDSQDILIKVELKDFVTTIKAYNEYENQLQDKEKRKIEVKI